MTPSTSTSDAEVLCCGHACIDLIPEMGRSQMPSPGYLVKVGQMQLATGGSVSNTGLSLHRMGVKVRLVARLGDDLLGHEIDKQYEAFVPGSASLLRVVPGEQTSYSVVISPSGEDRSFLHCPGANDSFIDSDVTDDAIRGVRVLHFGYPPAMKAICDDDGRRLVRLFERARSMGVLTSLDMCGVDPKGWAGQIDWTAFLKKVLPVTDLFLPSRDELAAMTNARPEKILDWGCNVLVIKDGEDGLNAWTSAQAEAICPGWGEQQRHAPSYIVDVKGTTGAGDATIAGFIAGTVRGEHFDRTLDLACAAGAHSVMQSDAISGQQSIEQLKVFLDRDPPRRSRRTL